MSVSASLHPSEWTAEDLLEHFGPIPLRRIRPQPVPGTATEQDLLDIREREARLFELADGVLVEKTMGLQESFLAVLLARLIGAFVEQHDLGIVLGTDGMARLGPGLVRIPDVSFISWDRLPGRKIPAISMLSVAPNLVIEVLSPANTRKEMHRKLGDYFEAGVQLVWYVDPKSRTVTMFSSSDAGTTYAEPQTVDGGKVLPGFELHLATLFAQLER